MEKGLLYIVATPIGNLGDITIRAKEILTTMDIVLCEDTRVTKKLLHHIASEAKTMSYHQHSADTRLLEVAQLLSEGQNLALVTDAGTPGISDPGNELVAYIAKLGYSIVPIPGVSAVIAALSVSGFPTDKFVFLGFPPQKKRRQKYFEELAQFPYTVVFYESNHRIHKTLENLQETLPANAQICIMRELTKKFESIYRGNIQELIDISIPAKGEFVIVISQRKL